jgi:hypothetical protein
MANRAAEGGRIAGDEAINKIKTRHASRNREVRIDASAAGQNTEGAIEGHNEDKAEPEGRSRNADDRQGAHHMVDRSVAVDGREHAERRARECCDQKRHKSKFKGSREEGNDILDYRPIGAKRNAEIAAQNACEVAPILFRQWAVEAHLLADACHYFIARPVAGDEAGGIAGDHVRDRKGDQRNAEYHQH